MLGQQISVAVERNPVSLMVPCHRVLGAGGALTGYAGGIQRKQALLALKGMTEAHRPLVGVLRPVQPWLAAASAPAHPTAENY